MVKNEHTEEFIKNNFAVFLLPEKSKVPFPGSRGVNDATTDVNIIRSWQTQNIGIATGEKSKLYPYDIDKKPGTDALSKFLKILNLPDLQAFIKTYPGAVIIRTGSGGLHIYWGIPKGMPADLRNSTDIGGIKGLDVRGNGGYVVAPGSIHPNGNEYKIIHGSLDKIPEMPMELYRFWYFATHQEEIEKRNEIQITESDAGNRNIIDFFNLIEEIRKKYNISGNKLEESAFGSLIYKGYSEQNLLKMLGIFAKEKGWKPHFGIIKDSFKRINLGTHIFGFPTLIKEIKESGATEMEIQKVMDFFPQNTDFVTFIEDAYNNGTTYGIEKLHELHIQISTANLKEDEKTAIVKKLHKIVYTSLAKLLKCTLIKQSSSNSSEIIEPEIYIKTQENPLFFSNSNNQKIRSILNYIYSNTISTKAKEEIIHQISDLAEVISFDEATQYIKFNNDYIYNFRAHEIMKYAEDMFIIRKFDFDYDPAATCSKWLKFLNSSVQNTDIPVLQEYIGYIFYNGLPAQNFGILKGPTRSGKGTTLTVITHLLGQNNISAVPAAALFSKDDLGHNLASLEGKLVNIDGETPPNELRHISNLKKFSGMDLIWANEKYRVPHAFIYTGKLLFALNSLPKIALNDSETDSFFSRILIINYKESHITDQNPNLANELIEELPGIFNWAMEGLKRLKSNGFKFSSTQNLEDKQRLYTLESDPIKAWVDDNIEPGEDEYTPADLYKKFLDFCQMNSIDPSMNVKNLRSFQLKFTDILKLREDLNFHRDAKGHNNSPVYIGFKLTNHKPLKESVDPELQKLLSVKKTLEDLNIPTTDIDRKIKEYKATQPGNTGNSTIDNTGTQNPGNSDIDSLPDGPVKQSLIEEREDQKNKATRKPVNESEHAPMIMDYRYRDRETEPLYYRLNKDFNQFDGAFFYSGHIIVDSVRKIMVPGTSDVAYALYKLRIPKHAKDSDYPKGWLRFTTSAEPLDEKAYNVLSKGDQQ